LAVKDDGGVLDGGEGYNAQGFVGGEHLGELFIDGSVDCGDIEELEGSFDGDLWFAGW
jgi:hypothetical protein